MSEKRLPPDENYLRFSIFGAEHTGKSSFCTSFPNMNVIDIEKGYQFLRDNPPAPYCRTDFEISDYGEIITTEDFMELIHFLERIRKVVNADKSRRYTLVIDPMTRLWTKCQTLYKMVTGKIMSDDDLFATKHMNLQEWGPLKAPIDRMRETLATTLAEKIYVNQAVITLPKARKDGTIDPKLIKSVPKTEGSFRYEVDVALEFLAVDDLRNTLRKPYVALVHKDRSQTFPVGSLVHLPQYEMFKDGIMRYKREPTRDTVDNGDGQSSDLSSKIEECMKDPEIVKLFEAIGLTDEAKRRKSVAKYSGDREMIIRMMTEALEKMS